MTKLKNPQHEIFCLEYLKDFNASRAYRDAGYSENGARQSAFRLLTHADVQARLTGLIKRRAEKVQVSAEWVLEKLVENTEGALQEGERVAANGSLKLLGQHIGMFETRVNLRGEVEVRQVDVRDPAHAIELLTEQLELLSGKKVVLR